MSALPEPHVDASERRVAPRMRTLKRAKVIFNNGFSTFDCIVRNISASGALLTIDEAAHLPKEFLIVVGEDQDQRPAKLVYRRGLFAGIRFRDVSDEPHGDAGEGGRHPKRESTGSHDHSDMREGKPVEPSSRAGGIRRVEPEILPAALTRHFRWSRAPVRKTSGPF